MPGLAGESHVGDGITLFLDQPPPPGDARYAAFDDFRNRLVHALIAEMRQRHRHYTLNLMVQAADLVPRCARATSRPPLRRPRRPPAAAARGRASARAGAAGRPSSATWTFDGLLDYLVRAEDPPFRDGRIAVGTGGYRSHTNVTVRYLVALPEPTTLSKKTLREAVESTPALAGTNRAILLRRILPLVSVRQQPAAADERRHGLLQRQLWRGGAVACSRWPMRRSPTWWKTTLRSTISEPARRARARCAISSATGAGAARGVLAAARHRGGVVGRVAPLMPCARAGPAVPALCRGGGHCAAGDRRAVCCAAILTSLPRTSATSCFSRYWRW